jgi:hexosaminidase
MHRQSGSVKRGGGSPFGAEKVRTMLFLASLLLGQLAGATQPPVWPLPSAVDLSDSKHVALDGSFQFTSVADYGSVVNNAMSRYQTLIAVPQESTGTVKTCKLDIADAAEVPIVNSDESYSLNVDADGVCTISSKTVWGALRGLESFTHFLVRSADMSRVELVSSAVSVTDAPRFGHRGMLIDTARHYLSVPTIQKVIDALPVNKFNVLHWHAVDAESFPIEVRNNRNRYS